MQKWLEDEYPVRHPVNVLWSKERLDECDPCAVCGLLTDERGDKEYFIVLSLKHVPLVKDVGYYMIHEWVHLVLGLNYGHGPPFDLQRGVIERDYNEGGGFEKTIEY